MIAIDKLKEVSAFLSSRGIEDSAKEAEMLITETLHISKSELYSGNLEISDEISKQIDSLALRRSEGEPVQYVIGHVDFYGLRINVGKGVLIPRPETELLVEQAIKALSSVKGQVSDKCLFLDLCTGSGCIALALGRHFPQAVVYGIDKLSNAIAYAEHNRVENKITNVHFMQGDLFEPIMGMRFDCIISNPPYIKRSEIPGLQREVRDYEPIEALDGGEDGLDFYRRILSKSPEFLKDNGLLIMEIGIGQSEDILSLALKAHFSDIEFIEDYAGIRRIFIGKFK